MFAVILRYVRPREEIDLVLADHRAFLVDFYAKGFGVASGRQIGAEGGVIVATAPSRAALEAELDKDPFKIKGVARYDIHEFEPRMVHPALRGLVS
jgi:uncharacterized protein YciI